ncbi:MAG: hypothetical protein U9Q12_02715 [Patescibacteria group bacterium]|nr:hypothetical protein [Patescibacteria group bacterium]
MPNFEKKPTPNLSRSQETIPTYESQKFTKNIIRDWIDTNKLDQKIEIQTKKFENTEKNKQTIAQGHDWDDDQYTTHSIDQAKTIETDSAQIIIENDIMHQLTGRPITPENGTGTYMYGHYNKNNPTIAFVNGMGELGGFANIVTKERSNNNIIMIGIDYSKPLHENVTQITQELQQLKDNNIKIDDLIAHSAGNRFTFELLHELGVHEDTLLQGTEIIGLNPKFANEAATGHSTGISGFFTNIAGNITGGGYGHVTEIMDSENSTNNYLKGELHNVHKALGDGKISFIVASNDPHNPERTTSAGALFYNVLDHADAIKYIKPPSQPHEWLLEN